MAKTSLTQAYDSSSIQTLRFPDDIRSSPGMFIGSTDSYGLWVLIREMLDNAIDEFLAGRGSSVQLHVQDGEYWVVDDANGIPQGVQKHVQHINGKDVTIKTPTMQAVFAELHTSGKFHTEAYKISRGTHGIGVKATNALSKFLNVYTCYEGQWYSIAFKKGKIVQAVEKCKAPKLWDGSTVKRGTLLHMAPDLTVFSAPSFPSSLTIEWAEIATLLSPGFKVIVSSPKGKKEFFSDKGPSEFVTRFIEKHDLMGERQMFEYKSELADVIIGFTNYDGCSVRGFVNGLSQAQGGKHVESVTGALYAGLKPFIKTKKVKEDGKTKEVPSFKETDLKEGLVGMVNMYLHKATYSSQDKARLSDDRAGEPFEQLLEVETKKFFQENKALATRLCERAAQMNALKQKFTLSKAAAKALNGLRRNGLPAKFASWDLKTKPQDRELYIVEGDSAGGCFVGSTKVRLLNGVSKRFDTMVKEAEKGIKHYGYAYDLKSEEIKVIEFDSPRITKHVDELIEVTLSNGQKVRCTIDHPWLTREGEYVAAENLETGTALMPHTEFIATDRHVAGRRVVVSAKKSSTGKPSKRGLRTPVFHLSAELNKSEMRKKKKLEDQGIKTNIHHSDFDRLNDMPSNLEVMVETAHRKLHAQFTEAYAGFKEGGDNQHALRMSNDPEYRKQVTNAAKEFFSKFWADPENRKAQSERTSAHFQNATNRRVTSEAVLRAFGERWIEIAKFAGSVNRLRWEQAKKKLHPKLNLRHDSWPRYFESLDSILAIIKA